MSMTIPKSSQFASSWLYRGLVISRKSNSASRSIYQSKDFIIVNEYRIDVLSPLYTPLEKLLYPVSEDIRQIYFVQRDQTHQAPK